MIRKLYISADIEGICGIADWKETYIGEAQGDYFRAEMTREVAAACEAAVAAGLVRLTRCARSSSLFARRSRGFKSHPSVSNCYYSASGGT